MAVHIATRMNRKFLCKKLDDLANQLLTDATEIKPTGYSANNSDKNASVNTKDIDRLSR